MCPAPATALIALGSNLGDRDAHLQFAISQLAVLSESALLARSPIIETAPVGPVAQGPYLNAAAMLETSLDPHGLLAALLDIERRAGRDRHLGERWGPRTLDVDLLAFGDRVIAPAPDTCPEAHQPEPPVPPRAGEQLILPHPRLHERLFVLEPLAAIAPAWRHPVLGRTVTQMLGDRRSRARE